MRSTGALGSPANLVASSERHCRNMLSQPASSSIVTFPASQRPNYFQLKINGTFLMPKNSLWQLTVSCRDSPLCASKGTSWHFSVLKLFFFICAAQLSVSLLKHFSTRDFILPRLGQKVCFVHCQCPTEVSETLQDTNLRISINLFRLEPLFGHCHTEQHQAVYE